MKTWNVQLLKDIREDQPYAELSEGKDKNDSHTYVTYIHIKTRKHTHRACKFVNGEKNFAGNEENRFPLR
jgi:hypothetical protein